MPYQNERGGLQRFDSNGILAVASALESVSKLGNAYFVNTNKVLLAASGNVRISFQNPAASGVNIVVYAFSTINDLATIAWSSIYENPTTGLPVAALAPFNQNRGSSNVTKALVKADSSLTVALSGGTLLETIGVPGNARTAFKDMNLVIPPNNIVGFNIPLAVAGSLGMQIYYYEEAI